MADDETVAAVRALSRLSRVLERRAGELNLAQYRVLAAVGSGVERASRVAARLALGRPTVSASVEALCSRGLLRREDDSGDQRAIQLSLTEDGRRQLDQAEGAMAAELSRICQVSGRSHEVIAALVVLGDALEASRAEQQ